MFMPISLSKDADFQRAIPLCSIYWSKVDRVDQIIRGGVSG